MPFNSIFSWLIKKRIHQIDLFKKYPIEVQDEILKELISKSYNTLFGKQYQTNSINNYLDFKNKIPLSDYPSLKPYIDRVIKGQQNVLWPTKTKWFAKSSGTTADKSKFIPVTKETLEIYGPIALRVGMQKVRGELEDLAFKCLHPLRAEMIESAIKKASGGRKKIVYKIRKEIKNRQNESNWCFKT